MSEIFEQVTKLLQVEACAIQSATKNLNQSAVEKAVEILSNCKGKIVLLGIGKSGIIANKIAETMTSTGTVAIFLHPSDALHGSLGVISRSDVVIALSNSGETDEILQLLPSIKSRNVPIISIALFIRSLTFGFCDVPVVIAAKKSVSLNKDFLALINLFLFGAFPLLIAVATPIIRASVKAAFKERSGRSASLPRDLEIKSVVLEKIDIKSELDWRVRCLLLAIYLFRNPFIGLEYDSL